MVRAVFHHTVIPGDALPAGELLARASGLSKSKIKDAMNKGAAWLQPAGRAKQRRLRRFTAQTRAGDTLTFHYDAALLAKVPPMPRCVVDEGRYSVWHKPRGLMAQGTQYGDHCSLLRQAEIMLEPRREAYLIHRLDQDAEGLMLIAHDQKAAAVLSRLFSEGAVMKRYRVEVQGALDEEGAIDAPLDGKSARTSWKRLSYDIERQISTLDVTIDTGRLHQIRRHFAALGHPVVGDRKYGSVSNSGAELRLAAVGLEFRVPWRGTIVRYTAEPVASGVTSHTQGL